MSDVADRIAEELVTIKGSPGLLPGDVWHLIYIGDVHAGGTLIADQHSHALRKAIADAYRKVCADLAFHEALTLDMLKEAGVIDQATRPLKDLREENARLREALEDRDDELCPEGEPPTGPTLDPGTPWRQLPLTWSSRSVRVLDRSGAVTVGDILLIGSDGLRAFYGCGRVTLDEITSFMRFVGHPLGHRMRTDETGRQRLTEMGWAQSPDGYWYKP